MPPIAISPSVITAIAAYRRFKQPLSRSLAVVGLVYGLSRIQRLLKRKKTKVEAERRSGEAEEDDISSTKKTAISSRRSNKSGLKGDVDAVFFARLAKLVRILIPGWTSKEVKKNIVYTDNILGIYVLNL